MWGGGWIVVVIIYTYACTYAQIRMVNILCMFKVPLLLSAIPCMDIYASSHASIHMLCMQGYISARWYTSYIPYICVPICPSQAYVCSRYVIAFLYVCLHMHVHINAHWYALVPTSICPCICVLMLTNMPCYCTHYTIAIPALAVAICI